MPKEYPIVLFGEIEQRIFFVCGQRVMIDRDIADLYQVETKHLNRQVKRNSERFPVEFMFQLSNEEKDQLVTNWHRFSSLKHSTTRPYAFTEHGVAMLSSVLKSKRAIQVNIQIIKTFIRLREIASTHKELSRKLKDLDHNSVRFIDCLLRSDSSSLRVAQDNGLRMTFAVFAHLPFYQSRSSFISRSSSPLP